MGVFYVSREEVASAPDIKASAYMYADIDRAIERASRSVEKLCHRVFYPVTATRYKDYPNDQNASSGRLWLDADELVSLTSFVSGGVTIPTASVFLEPINNPPYSRIEIDRSSSYALAGGGTAQRSQVIAGVFAGCVIEEEDAGTLVAGITASVTAIQLTTSPGVGSLVRIGTERMLVTGKTWVASGQTAQTPDLTASNSAASLAVTNGALFQRGELLLLDTEQVLVQDIVGNALIVKRAWGGTPLAAHSGSTIYWARALTVTRGAVGTTAALHALGDASLRWLAPAPIAQLTEAYALDSLFQRSAAYARTIGSGDNEQSFNRRAIKDLEAQVRGDYGRIMRMRAV